MELRELLKQYSNEEVVASLEDDRLRFLNAQYTKIYNIFDKIKNVGYASEEDITLLRSIINKTNHPLP